MMNRFFFITLLVLNTVFYGNSTHGVPISFPEVGEEESQSILPKRELNGFDEKLLDEEHRKKLQRINQLLEQRSGQSVSNQRKNLKKATKLVESFEDSGEVELDQTILNSVLDAIKERRQELYDFICDKYFKVRPIKRGNLIEIGNRGKELDIVTTGLSWSSQLASRTIDFSGEGFTLYIPQQEYQIILDNLGTYKSVKDVLKAAGYTPPPNVPKQKPSVFYRGWVGAISLEQTAHLQGFSSAYVPLNDLIVPQKKETNPQRLFPIALSDFDKQCLSEKYQGYLLGVTTQDIPDIERKAKRENDDFAQYILGILYTKGVGVRKNFIKATEWLEKSANNGNPEAQFKLASHYEICLVKRPLFKRITSFFLLNKNPYLNFYWYERAAQQGHPAAQCTLGEMYAGWRSGYNDGLETNFDEAKKWLKKSAKSGFEAATEGLQKIPEREEEYVRQAEEVINKFLEKKRLKRKDIQKIDEIVESYKKSGCTVKWTPKSRPIK